MLEALSTPHNRTVTFILLAACCVSAIAAVSVGIADNPPGLLLALVAASAFVLAWVHPWRTARKFRYLFYGSFLGLVGFAILAAVVDVYVGKWVSANAPALRGPLEGFGTVAFVVALSLFPPAFVIGLVGWIVMAKRNRPRETAGSAPVT
jgi:cytochrome b561